MDKFRTELEVGEIHLRDKWQFELKSEFIPHTQEGINSYIQEFYLFIPNALQVNEETYSKSQFYQDQTNLIRYKTPEFRLEEIYDPKNPDSPLSRLAKLKDIPQTEENIPKIEDELKLFGNTVRSALRVRIGQLLEEREREKSESDEEQLAGEITSLCAEIEKLRRAQIDLLQAYLKQWSALKVHSYWIYLDEFISQSIDYYLTGLLAKMKLSQESPVGVKIFNIISAQLNLEKQHREHFLHLTPINVDESARNETLLYRSGLLNKFVLDALLLPTSRSSLDQRFHNIIGGISAALAMLVFLVLLAWQGKVFLINSLPFILLTVVLYVLKDRMKEGLKLLSYRQFHKWFPDYKTDIRSSDGKLILGELSESFSYVREDQLPPEIIKIRNREFHFVLETYKRPERVIYYKKIIKLYPISKVTDPRRNAFNLIFRYNISNFLRMAEDPSQEYITFDSEKRRVLSIELPKIYHINIILKNSYIAQDGTKKTELKKFRLIVDKDGIRRIETVSR